MVTTGADPAAAAAAAAPADTAATRSLVGIINAIADLFGYTPSGDGTPALTSLADLGTFLPTVATAIAANPSAALLPIQGVYYMGMLGSTPARMFMSGGGGGGAGGISADALDGMKDSLLANVGKLVDDKAVRPS